MNWEQANGIATIVSAVCAVISLGYMLIPHKSREQQPYRAISLDKFMHFLLASSGWVLVCISILWIFEPFGPFPLDRQYKQFYGILLSFPAVVIFMTGYKYLIGKNK